MGKAVEADSKDAILKDCHAKEVLQHLGYGLDYYDRRKQNPMQVGCCLRAKWMDERTLEFIKEKGRCQVIQLGAELDDRFRRIGMPQEVEIWYDLDLKEVAEMRREMIPEVERNEIVSMDMFDTSWMDGMKENGLPVLVIIEGVLMFMEEEKIKGLLTQIGERLGKAVVLCDAIPALRVGKTKYHDSITKYNKEVEYKWGVKDINDLKRLSDLVREVKMVYMSDLPKAYKFAWWLRMVYRIPYFYRKANQCLIRMEIGHSQHNSPIAL